MILLLFFSFLAGLVTILAPCIWPVLPIVLSSSLGTKGHQRPFGITLGVMVSFSLATLFLSTLVRLFHFDPNNLRIFAVVVIGFLGLTMVIPALSGKLEVLVSRISSLFGRTTQNTKTGFIAGFITGLSLGIVWAPCAGPILATVAVLSATGKVTLSVALVTLSYVIGVGIPLFIFAYGGQQLLLKSKILSAYTGRIQQIFGVIMLLSALAIYTNYDQYLQVQLLNAFPQLNVVLNGFENNNTVTNQLNALKGSVGQNQTVDTSGLFNTNMPAPDFVGITHWLNTSKQLSIKDLKGKVVLVDFWTYTCINCIRTLPHVTAWYDTYKNNGFVVIGVHTPEFAFEHDTQNVANAIAMYHIHYPVAQDNNYDTWNAYNNEYWPAEYLIDANGSIRREDFGEGQYDQMEMAIRALLQEAGKKVTQGLSSMPDKTPTSQISPETYVGSDRAQYYYPDGSLKNGTQNFILEENPPLNSFSLGGTWSITTQQAIAGDTAALTYHFIAQKVFLVLAPHTVSDSVKVFLDGKLITSDAAGSDVNNGIITLDHDRLYNLVDLHGKTEEHTLKLEFLTPGTAAFAFTFG